MSTLEQEEEQRTRLASNLKALADIRAEDLVREEALGAEMSFGEALPLFRRILSLATTLRDVSLDPISYPILKEMADQAETAQTTMQEIAAFTTKSDNPQNVRQALIDRIQNAYDPFFCLRNSDPQLFSADKR